MGINLDEIVALAVAQLRQQALVDDLENSLAEQKAILRRISEEDLPQAMAEARLSTFKLETGQMVSVKKDFSVGIPAGRRDEAYNWLEGRGFGGLIKTKVITEYGKGELEKAQKLAIELMKKKLNVVLARDVHWQTLKAFVNEQIRAGKAVPMEMFGAVAVNKATVE